MVRPTPGMAQWALLAGLLLHCTAAHAAAIAQQELFASGISDFPWSKGQYACYRIPALMRTTSGTLLAFISERISPTGQASCSDDNPVNLVMRRSTDNGETWSPTVNVFSTGTSTNPLPIYDDNTGLIYLFTNVYTKNCDCDMQYVTSADEGLSWDSTPVVLTKDTGVIGSALTHGITLKKTAPGRLIGCMRKICKNSCPADYHSAAFYSDDGKAWVKSEWQEAGTTECQIAELSNGNLYMTSRYYQGWAGPKNVRLAAWSRDGGATWGATQAVPELIDNGFACEGSLASDPLNDRVYFVHPDSTGRSNLTLYTSSGNATHWEVAQNIYPGSSVYSDTVVVNPGPQGDGKVVGVLYEADNCDRTVFAKLSL